MARRPYPWPASKLTPSLMHQLHCHSLKTGKRITVVVQEAVAAYIANTSPDALPDPEPRDIPLASKAADGAR